MNWFVEYLIKEARGRRFRPTDRVRYFTENRKGKGKGVVLTPSFSRGEVVDFNSDTRQYSVRNEQNEVIDVHPRNLIPDSVSRAPRSETPFSVVAPAVSGPVAQGEVAEIVI
ncbi:MAG: hypothetical protein ACXAC5_00090 [Promethearchaeota archaeon]|jgi:hypothetical protein